MVGRALVVGHAHRCWDASVVHTLLKWAAILVGFAPFENAFVVVTAPTWATIRVSDTFQNLALKLHATASRATFGVNHTLARKLTQTSVCADESRWARPAIGALGWNWEALTVFARETFGALVVGHALVLRDTGVCNAAKSCRTITVLAALQIRLADVLDADQTRIEAVRVLSALHRNALSVHTERSAWAIAVLFTHCVYALASITRSARTLRVLGTLTVVEANAVDTRLILRAIRVFFTLWRTDSLDAACIWRTFGIVLTVRTLHALTILANFAHVAVGVGFANLRYFTVGADTVFASLSGRTIRLVKTKVRYRAEVRNTLRTFTTICVRRTSVDERQLATTQGRSKRKQYE